MAKELSRDERYEVLDWFFQAIGSAIKGRDITEQATLKRYDEARIRLRGEVDPPVIGTTTPRRARRKRG